MTTSQQELTSAQLLVLRGLAEGKKLNVIASDMPPAMRIGEHGVHYHVKQIYLKLGIQSRAEAAVAAVKLKLL